jgi:Ni/Fe-hydrogenase subunit HybB-like protein
MAKFFSYFPKTFYIANNTTSGVDVVTNIITRFKFEDGLKNNSTDTSSLASSLSNAQTDHDRSISRLTERAGREDE